MAQKISLMAAMGNNRVIGKENTLPWHMPADWENFRKVTENKPFIMGKKSYLAPDKLLSGKRNLILAHTQNFDLCPNCEMVTGIQQALDELKNEPEIFILGGAYVFSQTIQLANYMYLTMIHADFEGDAYFPEYEEDDWRIVKSDFHHKDIKNPFDYTFVEFERV